MTRFALFILALVLVGCGSTTERQTKIVEVEDLIAGPMTVETPFGTFIAQPVRVQRRRTQMEVEESKLRYDMPEAGAVMQAAVGGLGGPLAGGGIVGLLSAGIMLWNKAKNDRERDEMARSREILERQRDEVIAGVERAKKDLGDRWEVLTGHLEAEQSTDTKKVVRDRTA